MSSRNHGYSSGHSYLLWAERFELGAILKEGQEDDRNTDLHSFALIKNQHNPDAFS